MSRNLWRRSLLVLAIIAGSIPFYRAAIQGEDAPAATETATEEGSQDPEFVRLSHDENGDPLALETAIVTYVPANGSNQGLEVVLIGAIHIAERSYYEQLNEEFTKYDALLFELVADENVQIEKGSEPSNAHPISAMQNGMKSMLGLEHQLAWIDYNKKNFVHADMSPEEFAESMAKRGEGLWQMFFKMMGQSIAMQSNDPNSSSDLELILALFDPNRSLALKRAMAKQFGSIESGMAAFDGPEGSTIITERNKVALEVLKTEIGSGKKKLAVFYGAGHLADMEKRLLSDFGLKRDKERWLAAWILSDSKKDK